MNRNAAVCIVVTHADAAAEPPVHTLLHSALSCDSSKKRQQPRECANVDSVRRSSLAALQEHQRANVIAAHLFMFNADLQGIGLIPPALASIRKELPPPPLSPPPLSPPFSPLFIQCFANSFILHASSKINSRPGTNMLPFYVSKSLTSFQLILY